MKAVAEVYNEKPRVRFTIVSANDINYATESRQLIEKIAQMLY